MKRYLQITGLFLVGALFLQFASYNLFGRRSIHIACMKNLKTLAYDVDSVGIYSPHVDLSEEEKEEIKRALNFKSIEFTSDPNIFSNRFRLSNHGYGMGYEIDELNWISADIREYNGMLEYGEVWKARYVWILVGWVKLTQENVGQS